MLKRMLRWVISSENQVRQSAYIFVKVIRLQNTTGTDNYMMRQSMHLVHLADVSPTDPK